MGSSIRLQDLAIPADQNDAHFQRTAVADLLQRQMLSFPGAQPVSFARQHIGELQRTDYFLCEKTDGMRCLLYLTQHVGEGGQMMEAQYLIDRKNDYYYIHRDTLHIPAPQGLESFHIGTLLDGELVRQRYKDGTEAIKYLIFDCLAIDGQSIMNRTFDVRQGKTQTFIMRPIRDFAAKYAEDVAHQPFQLEMKEMQLPYGFEMMFKIVLPKLPHGNDGLILTCKSTPYVSGTDKHILKWKPPEENTVDLRLLLGLFPQLEGGEEGEEDFDAIPEMELHVNHGEGVYSYFGPLRVTEQEWEAMKGMEQQLDGRIIECYRDPEASVAEGKNIWRAKLEPDGTPRFRDDKTDANHITTVDSVLKSIEDAVSEQDLINAAGAIKHEYKARQAAQAEEAKRKKAEMEQARRTEAEERRKAEAARKEAANKAAQEKLEPEDDGPTYDED